MRVTVIGAGAIGGTVGVLLHRAGHEVVLVDRDATHVAAINRDGFRLSGLLDVAERVPAIVPNRLPDLVRDDGPLGLVVLAVKAMDTEAAVEQIRPHLAPDGCIVSYQNGLNEEVIARIVGPERTVGAFVHFGADLLEPGHVVLATRPTTYISELDGKDTPRIREIAKVLSAVTEVEITNNLEGYLWGKLGYAALAFVVSSVDAPIDEVVMVPDARTAIRGTVAEVVDVARAQGIRLENIHGFEPSLFDRRNPNRIAETDALFERWAAEGKTAIKRHMGIHRDIKVRKRRTEVDYQIGPVVEQGRALGVPTPVNARLVELIHQIEAGKRAQDWSTIAELAHVAPLMASASDSSGGA
ncbi:MAG: 2-dehydropantoate 2-reductase [Chloroflexota bacterium]|nr:2-dehydropantoate 2-reductase [Chloroflexota bacterium]